MNNPETYLTHNVETQYSTSTNLGMRIDLHSKFSTNKYGWARRVFDHIEFQGKFNILELGCGNGNLGKSNLDRLPRGLDIVLSYFSSGMLEDCRKNLADKADWFNFRVIDAQNIPFKA
jgi:ubiquinone/menaquinone biosynthesis C-methylase UbiE